jgi:hypothetical protein
VISAESLGSLNSWSMSAVRTSCPVTRATPRRSAASRCQMSRARCWPGERSTVRLVRRLRVRPMAKASVGAAATDGVSGVTAACWVRDRSAPAPARLLSGLMCNLLAREPDVSMSVDQFSISVPQGPSTAAGRLASALLDAAGRHEHKPMTEILHFPASDHRQEWLEIRRWASIRVTTMPRSWKGHGVPNARKSFGRQSAS